MLILSNFFDKEKYAFDFEKELKNTSYISIQSMTMVKTICRIYPTKKNKKRKNGDKDGKVF